MYIIIVDGPCYVHWFLYLEADLEYCYSTNSHSASLHPGVLNGYL